MVNKIMILGGGRAQLGLIKQAKKMNLYVIVVGIEGSYPGYDLADKVYYVDVNNKQKVLDIAITEKIDGICLVCTEIGLSTLGYVCDNLGLKGPSEENALISSNKLEMKQLLTFHNVKTPKYIVVHNTDNYKEAIKDLDFPVMVKAIDLQGSKGVFKSLNISECIFHIEEVFKLSKETYCIIEEYIEGIEFGAQAFVYDNEFLFIEPHGDEVLKKEDKSIPIGHYMPYNQDKIEDLQEIKNIVKDAILALNFNNCAVNIDLIKKNGQYYILELSSRAGANNLAELTSARLGLNYYELILLGALNKNVFKFFKENIAINNETILASQIYFTGKGKIKKIIVEEDPEIISYEMYVKEGAYINNFNSSNDCLGNVICQGKTLKECNIKVDDFLKNYLSIIIEH